MRTNSTRRRIAAVSVATAAIAALFTGLQGAQAQTEGELRTTANYRLGEVTSSARGRDVPALAVNPADPRHIVEVEHDLLGQNCRYNVSFDGGVTWPVSGFIRAPEGFPQPGAPVAPNPSCPRSSSLDGSVEFGSGQNVYVPFSVRRGEGAHGESVLVARSTDGGRNFAPGVVAANSESAIRYIQPEIAVHPGAGTGGADRLYVSIRALNVPAPTAQNPSATSNRVFVVVSQDGGGTWGPPVDVTGGANTTEPSEPVIGPDGTVYVSYRTIAHEPPAAKLVVARSHDGGTTWLRADAAQVRGYKDEIGSTFTGSSFPRMDVDPRNGFLYVVYMQGPPYPGGARQDHFIHPDVDALLIRSANGGVTWDQPVRVNDDPLGSGAPAQGPAQRHPEVKVAPNGRVDVVWQDRRHGYRSPTHSHLGNGEARMGDTYYDYSLDNGVTFNADRRITDKTQNLDLGYDHYGQVYWGWGPVMAHLGNDEILFAWMDSREGNIDNEHEDIYLAKLNVRSPAVIPVQRIPDNTRPAVSVDLSQWAYSGGAQAVLNVGFSSRPVTRAVIVNEGDPAAALVGSVLSRAHLGPLLASPASRLTPEVRAEVDRMDPIGAFVIGSEGRLGTGVVNDVAEAGVPREEIVRLAGSSPADTARLVALNMDRRSDSQRSAGVPAFDAVVVVNPDSPDAGAAAGLAAHRRLPILFAGVNSVPEVTREALRELHITTTLVVGGPGVVNDAVVASLPGARRLGGPDQYATSRAVLAESVGRLVPTNISYVADGDQVFDAAMAGAAAARTGALVVLAPGSDPAAAEQSLAAAGLRAVTDRLIVVRSFASLGGPGYRLVASDGGVFAFGGLPFLGSTGAIRLNAPMVGMAGTLSNLGYWLVAADGGVFAFGDAPYRGSTGRLRLNKPVVGMASTPSDKGYWLAASDGGVFAFGDAGFLGSTGSITLNQPIVGMASTPSGNGYWLVASDGGVFAFGDAQFFGSTGAIRLNKPVVGMASTPSGKGYHLVASDGGVFAFGDAQFFGSTGAIRLNQPVVGMDATPSARGYHLVASDGGVFAFGDAVFSGSTGAIRLNKPMVGMASVR